MPKRKKPGRKPSGLTVTKSFKLTPSANRKLARVAVNFESEAHAIRQALDNFFLAYDVRYTDNSSHIGEQNTDLAAA